MSRAYVRLDPAYYERKMRQGYPLAAIGALVGCFCMAEAQVERGRFRDLTVLRALLGAAGAKWASFLLEHGDLILDASGQVYVDGWDEWQEGDWQVKERMARVRGRARHHSSLPTEVPTVTSRPSGAVRGADKAGQPHRYSDAFKAFAQVTGNSPDPTERKWIDELCHDFSREVVAASMYQHGPERGLLGRISKELRRGAA